MDSVSSSPITPATSIVPPSTPPRSFANQRNQTTGYLADEDYEEEEEEEEDVEEAESPLLNSLQLSDKEQRYIEEISSTTSLTPRHHSRSTSYGQHPQSVPAYKFKSLRNFTPVHSQSPSVSSITDLEILQKDFENVKINQVQVNQQKIQKTQSGRYSVYIQNEDFEIYRPNPSYTGDMRSIQRNPKMQQINDVGPNGHKWWKSHGKSNSNGNGISGLTPPGFGFLKHKKSKSDIVS